jgi:hypothetical protein
VVLLTFQRLRSYIRESLSTPDMLALMGLFSSMSSYVNRQSTPLNKAFTAARCHARVRPFIRVNSIVSLKIGLAVEALETKLADIQTLTSSRTVDVPCYMFASHTGRVSHSAHSPQAP